MSAPVGTQLRWGTLETLLAAGDVAGVTDALVAADEQQRRSLAEAVRAYEVVPVELEHSGGGNEDYQREWLRMQELRTRRDDALRVAGAGCLTRAADIVSFLRSGRYRQEPTPGATDAVIRVLQAPGRPAIAAVAQGLATRLRPAHLFGPQHVSGHWSLVAGLLHAAQLRPPGTEAMVRGWIRHLRRTGNGRLAERLHLDPWLPTLLPHVFDQHVPAELDEQWPPALAQLCSDGHLDRAELLSACLRRMRAGDRPGAMRPVIEIHRLLAPTIDERDEHRQEYLGMLAGPHVAVADIAQRSLRSLDDAGRLPAATIAEAARAVLLQPHKKLVRAQLDWLDTALDRRPAELLVLLEAVAVGLRHESVDLAERALRVLTRHLPAAGAAGPVLLSSAGADLDADLRRQIDHLLGSAQPAHPVCPTPPTLPAPRPPEPMPDPIGSPAELAAAAAHLVHDPDQPVAFERVLDGVVRLAHADRHALARALVTVLQPWSSPVNAVLHAAAQRPWNPWAPADWERPSPPSWMIVHRAHELAGQLAGTPPPALLATPATSDGHVDPGRVLALLADAERAGWQPGPYDLSQALLRLPRLVDPDVGAAAGRLASPAGRLFAGWLRRGGLPQPEVSVVELLRRPCAHGVEHGYRRCWCTEEAPMRRTAAFASIDHEPLLTVPPGLLALPAAAAYQRAYGFGFAPRMTAWPLVLPAHREIIAAHVQPFLAPVADRDRRSGIEVLPVLARSSGPFGPAMALCLAYALAAQRDTERLAATDAVLHLAAGGQFDGVLVGRELSALITGGAVVLKRAVSALTELSRADANEAVWAIARTLLPHLLVRSGPPAGTPDLLALAAAAAAATGAHGDFPELAAVVARGGRSRLVTEAARLSRTLTSDRR